MMQEQFPVYIRKLLLLVILLIVILVIGGCSDQLSNSHPKALKGTVDFTQVDFKNGSVQLDGEWEFYWNVLLEPDEIAPELKTGYIAIPGTWNKYATDQGTISGVGYATYRLTILTDQDDRLALKIPRVLTAYKLWVNGELTAAAGTVGKTIDTSTPQYLPQVAIIETQQGKNEIVIQVSNFHHRSGGILESIKLGNEQEILGLRYANIANTVFLFGSLLFAGAYHLALFFFRKKNTSALYFGFFSVLIAIRTLLVGECYLIYVLPAFNWEIAHKLMTLSFYLGVPLILMFFLSVFPKYFHSRMIKTAQIIGGLFGILVILTPARIFTIFNPIYQVWTIITILYLFTTLIRIAFHKEKDSWLIILGATAFILSTVNDIVFLSIWMNDKGPSFLREIFKTGNLSSVGQFIFAFTNSLLLAKRFSAALEQEEVITKELTEVNANLDQIVLQRTEALVQTNQKVEQQKLELEKMNQQLWKLSLKDPLTKLWNRRKYDDYIKLEWNRCLRHQRTIGLLLLDIDYFKEYNDHHGHLDGDECLAKIGQILKNSLMRSTDMAVRYGGEEFIVVLPETTKAEVTNIANILRQRIEALHIAHGQSSVSSFVTVSIGGALTIPNADASHEDLFKAADKALYQAKAYGRNQFVFHENDDKQ